MADTAALVVALSAQLTKFEKDMQKAGIMAERAVGDIENKFSKMNPKVSTSFMGNLFANIATKGLDAAVKAVTDLADRFVELQRVAGYADVSMQWLYGLQAAGAKAGAAVGSINEAVKSLAFSLDEMKRGGDNALKTLLDANPKFMKGVNRDTMDVAQTLQVVSNIIKELPNQVQRVDVVTKLGMPAEAVALLQQGGAAIKQMADEAARAAPDLAALAAQSKLFGDIWDTISNQLQKGALTGFFIYLNYLASTYRMLLEGILPVISTINTAAGQMIETGIAKLKNAEKTIADAQAGNTTFADRWGALDEKKKSGGGSAVDPFARKAAAAPAAQRDEFARANDQINKHIELMKADTATMFLNVGEQERARTEATLMEAARRKHNVAIGETLVLTEEETRKIKEQGEASRQAALEQAKATQQLQRINQAYDTLGSAVSTAFADAIIEGKKLNEVLSSLLKTLARAAINSTITGLFNSFKPGAFAGGTDYAPGGLAMVGERGPELVNLPRGSQVIPNDVLRGGMSGGGSITYAPAIDARGASVEAVARLAQIIEQDRAMFASRTVATIQQARRGRVPGL
jgi:hypothetical protein